MGKILNELRGGKDAPSIYEQLNNPSLLNDDSMLAKARRQLDLLLAGDKIEKHTEKLEKLLLEFIDIANRAEKPTQGEGHIALARADANLSFAFVMDYIASHNSNTNISQFMKRLKENTILKTKIQEYNDDPFSFKKPPPVIHSEKTQSHTKGEAFHQILTNKLQEFITDFEQSEKEKNKTYGGLKVDVVRLKQNIEKSPDNYKVLVNQFLDDKSLNEKAPHRYPKLSAAIKDLFKHHGENLESGYSASASKNKQ